LSESCQPLPYMSQRIVRLLAALVSTKHWISCLADTK